MNREGSS